jgi:hypothetical protein
MRPLHDRMPVILDTSAEDVRLDTRSSDDALRSLFVPFSSERMEAIPVNPYVSNAKNEGPRCLLPAGASFVAEPARNRALPDFSSMYSFTGRRDKRTEGRGRIKSRWLGFGVEWPADETYAESKRDHRLWRTARGSRLSCVVRRANSS